MYFFHTVK